MYQIIVQCHEMAASLFSLQQMYDEIVSEKICFDIDWFVRSHLATLCGDSLTLEPKRESRMSHVDIISSQALRF